MTQQPTDQDALVALIKDRSDEEIDEAIAGLGVENVLDLVFAGMAERFDAGAAAGQTAKVQWDIAAADVTHSYHLDVADGACTLGKGAADAPRITLALSLADLMRFASGELDGMSAFMAGKLKLSGDMMLAQSLQAWFAA